MGRSDGLHCFKKRRAGEGQSSMSSATLTTSSTAQAQRLTERPAWKALEVHCATIRNLHLRQLFAEDPRRGERLTAEAAGIYLDYSKNRITDETIRLLVRLAEECGLRERVDAMFRGERINVTESVPSFTLPCARLRPSGLLSMASTSCPRYMQSSNGWLH